jgi:hypothetical protein
MKIGSFEALYSPEARNRKPNLLFDKMSGYDDAQPATEMQISTENRSVGDQPAFLAQKIFEDVDSSSLTRSLPRVEPVRPLLLTNRSVIFKHLRRFAEKC